MTPTEDPPLSPGSLPPPRWWQRGLAAVATALVYGLLLYLLIWVASSNRGWMPFVSGLVLLPMAVGGVVTAVSDPFGRGKTADMQVLSLIVMAVLLLVTMVFFGEGAICVVLGLPFFLAGNALGTWITLRLLRRLAERRRSARRYSTALLLPLAFLPLDSTMHWPERFGEVTSVVEIDADPARVWALTAEISVIDRQELPFTVSHALLSVPQPVDARLAGTGAGAVRHLRWTRGVTFQEIITDWQQERRLAWDFHFPPGSIPDAVEAHINVDSDYLTLRGGEYLLEPLESGGTRLVLTTRYRVASPINGYAAWWAGLFLNDFHHAVLTVVKARAEG